MWSPELSAAMQHGSGVHSSAISQALCALKGKVDSLEKQNKYYRDSITLLTAEMETYNHAKAPHHEVKQLEQLEGVIQDERRRVMEYQSEMEQQRKESSERTTIWQQDKDEVSGRLNAVRARTGELQMELEREKARVTQEQIERDAAENKLLRLEKERDAWRSDAVARVQQLEERHVELTTKRQEGENFLSSLQAQLEEERHARHRAEQGLDQSRALLEKALVLNQQLVTKLKTAPRSARSRSAHRSRSKA